MGNVITNDIVTNATNGQPEIKQGSAVVSVNKVIGSIESNDDNVKYKQFSDVENRLTNKFDEVDYYEIPGALHGGGITPTPSPTVTSTPTPTPTPTSAP